MEMTVSAATVAMAGPVETPEVVVEASLPVRSSVLERRMTELAAAPAAMAEQVATVELAALAPVKPLQE